MRFSIYIPAYNAEKTIKRCIESVLSQSFSDFEVIIINDGSIDSTKELVSKYASIEKRNKIYNQDNIGVFPTRLYAISKCSGDYVISLDSDDELVDNCLDIINKYLNLNNIDILVFNAYNILSNGKYSARREEMKNNTILDYNSIDYYLIKLIESDNYNSLWNKAIRRDLINISLLNNYINVNIGEDNLILIDCFIKAHKVLFISDILYKYYTNVGMTKYFRLDSFSNLKNRIDAKKSILSFYDKKNYFYELDVFFVKSCSKILVYSKNKLLKNNYNEFNILLKQMYNDNDIDASYKKVKKKIGILYRLPIFLLKHKMFFLLKFYKRIINIIRRG